LDFSSVEDEVEDEVEVVDDAEEAVKEEPLFVALILASLILKGKTKQNNEKPSETKHKQSKGHTNRRSEEVQKRKRCLVKREIAS
jgi:hypothetical protein